MQIEYVHVLYVWIFKEFLMCYVYILYQGFSLHLL